jgi:hypothetical protein
MIDSLVRYKYTWTPGNPRPEFIGDEYIDIDDLEDDYEKVNNWFIKTYGEEAALKFGSHGGDRIDLFMFTVNNSSLIQFVIGDEYFGNGESFQYMMVQWQKEDEQSKAYALELKEAIDKLLGNITV